MVSKLNCWEAKKCGREPGGFEVRHLGVCPAATDTSADGLNNGKNAGRLCWAVTGTLCGGSVQGCYAQKQLTCMTCDFYKRVNAEEGNSDFVLLKPGQSYSSSKSKISI